MTARSPVAHNLSGAQVTAIKITHDADGALAPESRAALIGALLAFVAGLTEPATPFAALDHLKATFAAQEEEVAGEFYLAWHLLVCSGMVVSNTFNPITGSLTVTSGSTIGPSMRLTSFVWSENQAGDEASQCREIRQ